MASSGKKKPERKMLGRSVIQTVSMASCWVLAMVEANRPMPRPESSSKPEQPRMRLKSPRTGTPNHQWPMASTSRVSMKARMTYGRILPTTSSHGRMGVTMSCSIVPRSRSRTIAVAVRMEVMANRIMPITPGIMKYELTRSGLYQTRVRTSSGGWKFSTSMPERASFSIISEVACCWPIRVAAASAVDPAVASEPSRMNAT